jgi:nucleotide-binding universal stress UspA family protein
LQDGRLEFATVVFATDLSAGSQNAGACAARLARHFQSELVLVHAFTLNQSAFEVELLKAKPSEERVGRLRQLEDACEGFRAQGLRARAELLEGEPAQVIGDFADAQTRPVLVLGTQGESRVERALLGSVAEGCLRRVACPAITVGPRVPDLDAAGGFHSIVYATDCSGMAFHAAPLAWALAQSFHSELRAVTIVEEHHVAATEVLANINFRTRQELLQHLGSHCAPALESHTVASRAKARGEILKYTQRVHGDLLILGVHRRASIELFDRNSITIQIIQDATCPVLTLTRVSVPGGEELATSSPS